MTREPPAGALPAAAVRANASAQADLMVCAEAKPAWFDAHNQIAGAARVLAGNIVPGLMSIGDDGGPAPSLAIEWSWESDTVLALTLADGISFAGGRQVDARSVCENLQRAASGAGKVFNAHEFEPIRKCEAIGATQVVLTLRRPFAPLVGALANGFGMLDLAQGDPPANSCGAGRFRLASTSRHAFRLLPRCGGGISVDWIFCTTGRARAARRAAGRADVLLGAEGLDAAEEEGWQRIGTPALGPLHLAFNLRRWPTSGLAFRHAVADAIDRDEVIERGFSGLAQPAFCPYPADSAFPLAVESGPRVAERPAKTRREHDLVLAVGGDAYLAAARAIARALERNVGVRVRVVSIVNPEWWPRRYLDADWDLAVQAWTPMPDPHFVYARRYASRGVHNAPGYADERFDRVVRAAERVREPTQRLELYAKAEALRARQMPTFYIAYPDRIGAVRPGRPAPRLRPSWAVDLPSP